MAQDFDETMIIDREEFPSYNNTVLWALYDPEISSAGYPAVEARDGDLFPHKTDWQMLYLIPDGFGINCCEGDYVVEEFEKLKCSYLAVVEGGRIDEMCLKSSDWTEIGREGTLVVFRKTATR